MFDVQQDRLGYGDLLRPESDYKLDFAVGMTYSLDLDAFLGVPVSMQEMGDMDSPISKSPFYVLEAIRKSNEKVAIFCNGGGMYLPANIYGVYSLLENSVFEVKLPDKQNFHPKLWVLLQSNNAGKKMIRFIVLSRNLTFDNSIDLVVSMTGEVSDDKNNNEKNQPLSDLLQFVASHCTDDVKKQKIQSFADTVMYVRKFEIQKAFEDYEFISLGINGVNGDNIDLFTGVRDAFIVSPFLSKDIVEKLTKGGGRKTLLTKKLPEIKDAFNRFDEVYVVKDLLLDNENHTKHDIHAKMYFTAGSKGNNLYIGSANCSHNAFYRNVEFLLKLKYAPSRGSYNVIANEFLGEKDQSPYELILELPEVEEDKNKEKDDWLNDKIRQVILCVERARIIKREERFDIRIYSKELPNDVNIKIAPLQRTRKLVRLDRETLLDNLLLKELSELFMLVVGDKKVVFKVPVENMPKERDNAIYKSIIDTKEKFIEYISFMISDNYVESYYQMQQYKEMIEESHASTFRRPIYTSLYENMLKLIVENPDKLKDIEDIIGHLDRNIIPKDFNEVYGEFKKVLKAL